MSGSLVPRVTPCMMVQFSPMRSAPMTVPTVCGRNRPPPICTCGETSMPNTRTFSVENNFANRPRRRAWKNSARRSRTTGAMRGLRQPSSSMRVDTRPEVAPHAVITLYIQSQFFTEPPSCRREAPRRPRPGRPPCQPHRGPGMGPLRPRQGQVKQRQGTAQQQRPDIAAAHQPVVASTRIPPRIPGKENSADERPAQRLQRAKTVERVARRRQQQQVQGHIGHHQHPRIPGRQDQRAVHPGHAAEYHGDHQHRHTSPEAWNAGL
jgi:hypothetical protein